MTKLGDELEAEITATDTESTARQAWADAWLEYFTDAQIAVPSLPILTAALDATRDVMRDAMTGLSTTGAAAIQAGLVAWWGAMAAAPSAYFTGATVITPPTGIASIATGLATVFAANTTAALSLEDSADAIAGVMHTANALGTATFPGPSQLVIV